MEAHLKVTDSNPLHIPLKIIGRASELRAEAVAELIAKVLGPQPLGDGVCQTKHNGAWISLTFWVTLPDAEAELPLREAIQKLPGVLTQL